MVIELASAVAQHLDEGAEVLDRDAMTV